VLPGPLLLGPATGAPHLDYIKKHHADGAAPDPDDEPAATNATAILRTALQLEMTAFGKERALFGDRCGDPFLPQAGVPEVLARYRLWPSLQVKYPLLFILACTVLAGGCGPATSICNESLQAIAKFLTCAQRGSAKLQYLSDAALSRVTLPKIIKDNLAFKEIVARGEESGFGVDFADVEDLIDAPPPEAVSSSE
jgi:hypothetical protein